jgi:hypothetical protein
VRYTSRKTRLTLFHTKRDTTHTHRLELSLQCLGGDLRLSQLPRDDRIGEVPEDSDPREPRNNLLQELQPFAA